jgi:hypothetical protein
MFVYYQKAKGGFTPALCDLQADYLTAALLQVTSRVTEQENFAR